MLTVTVDLGARSYPIHIGQGALGTVLGDTLAAVMPGRRAAVITNDTVWALYGDAVTAALGDREIDVFCMPDGEAHKTLATYGDALDFLLTRKHPRSTTIVAVGGGVVGDLAGFVAATYQRGVAFVQIPTTLLAQVDSSVGGKTAVNHPAGKNMIGAFYQPAAVVIDTDVLTTLPDREYAAGLAEVVKYGVIADPALFAFLEEHVQALNARDPQALAHVIARSCEIKAAVVAEDEREAGLRAILNFGHTFGHAIENLAGYGSWLHGEAVALGMVLAARFSERLRRLPQGDAQRIENLLAALRLPVGMTDAPPPAAMREAMVMDKKAVDGRIRFVVADALGRVAVTDSYATEALDATLAAFAGQTV